MFHPLSSCGSATTLATRFGSGLAGLTSPSTALHCMSSPLMPPPSRTQGLKDSRCGLKSHVNKRTFDSSPVQRSIKNEIVVQDRGNFCTEDILERKSRKPGIARTLGLCLGSKGRRRRDSSCIGSEQAPPQRLSAPLAVALLLQAASEDQVNDGGFDRACKRRGIGGCFHARLPRRRRYTGTSCKRVQSW